MSSKLGLLALLAIFIAFTDSTKVAKCREGNSPQLSNEDIEITACAEPPCILKRKTEPAVTIKFKSEKDVKEVMTHVSAGILGISVPFIGVDRTSACPGIYSADGKTKVGCPLQAGETYTYKNSFKVLEIYPKIRTNIHWALANNSTQEELFCFELMAKIT